MSFCCCLPLWKAAFPAEPDEDEAAKATRLEALAAAVEAAKAEVQQARGTEKQQCASRKSQVLSPALGLLVGVQCVQCVQCRLQRRRRLWRWKKRSKSLLAWRRRAAGRLEKARAALCWRSSSLWIFDSRSCSHQRPGPRAPSPRGDACGRSPGRVGGP